MSGPGVSPPPGKPETVLALLLSGLSATAETLAGDLAKVVGVWTAARAAVSTVASGIAVAATQAAINAANARYRAAPLTPPLLADMVVRNVLPDSTGAAGVAGSGYPPPMLGGIGGHSATDEAAFTGLDAERFAAMVADTGESYGIIDALRMFNRGQFMYALVPTAEYETGVPIYQAGPNLAGTYGITQAELDRVIAYSRVRPEFTADLLKLAKNTLSPADAVEMAVKQIVDQGTARSLFEAAGGVGEQFDALVDAAGDAAGVEKAVELASHKVITEGQLDQVLGLSRMNPRFYYLAHPDASGVAPLYRKWLAAYEVRLALTGGTIDTATATRWLTELGYAADQAQAFAVGVASAPLAKPKEETASMILKEYAAKLLTEAEATKGLTDLGYIPESVPYLLEYALAGAIIAARNSALSRVRAAYLVGDITSVQATTDMASIGVPQAAITNYLADWAVEAATPHLHLSAAQVGKLAEDGILSEVQAVAKWQAMGYSATDAGYLLAIYPPGSKAPPPAVGPGGTGPGATGG